MAAVEAVQIHREAMVYLEAPVAAPCVALAAQEYQVKATQVQAALLLMITAPVVAVVLVQQALQVLVELQQRVAPAALVSKPLSTELLFTGLAVAAAPLVLAFQVLQQLETAGLAAVVAAEHNHLQYLEPAEAVP